MAQAQGGSNPLTPLGGHGLGPCYCSPKEGVVITYSTGVAAKGRCTHRRGQVRASLSSVQDILSTDQAGQEGGQEQGQHLEDRDK